MDKINDTIKFIIDEVQQFGFVGDEKPSKKNYIFRNDTGKDSLEKGKAYFGFISPEEEVSGGYHDLSVVVFPDKSDESWLIALCVGTLGFKNDYDLASMPGARRLFTYIISKEGFCKTSFLDIDTILPKDFESKITHLHGTLNHYSKSLLACEIINNPYLFSYLCF